MANTHYNPYTADLNECNPDDKHPCGSLTGFNSEITGNWDLVTCKRCLSQRDRINAMYGDTEKKIVQDATKDDQDCHKGTPPMIVPPWMYEMIMAKSKKASHKLLKQHRKEQRKFEKECKKWYNIRINSLEEEIAQYGECIKPCELLNYDWD
mgnify:CR=1 FL=1